MGAVGVVLLILLFMMINVRFYDHSLDSFAPPTNNVVMMDPRSKACNSTTFNVTTPLFVQWEVYEQAPPLDFWVVQLGGNVGLNVGGGDPVWEYARPCHWQGAILEPQPTVFAQLKDNYADVSSRIETFNWAASDTSGYMTMQGRGETARLRAGSSGGDVRVVTLQE